MAEGFSWQDAPLKEFYLANRLSLAFFSNCTIGNLTLNPSLETGEGLKNHIDTAFKLISAALANPPPVATSRLPGLERDVLFPSPQGGEGLGARVVIACQGQFYVFENGVSRDELEEICQLSSQTRDPEVGLLTTLPRPLWAKYYPLLGEQAQLIAKSLLFVALDFDSYPHNDQQLAVALAHGNLANRWFDQSLQIIVFGNGRAGFNFDHTSFDAVPAGRYVQEIALDASQVVTPAKAGVHPPFYKITWPNHDELEVAIREAKAIAREELRNREIICGRVGHPASDKKIQKAIQLAVQKHFGESRVTSEAINMGHLPQGRYHTIFFDSPEAVEQHSELVKACKLGREINSMPCEITTSNLGYHDRISVMGFTDTDRNVLGIAYSQRPDGVMFHIKADGKYLGTAKPMLDLIDHFLQ